MEDFAIITGACVEDLLSEGGPSLQGLHPPSVTVWLFCYVLIHQFEVSLSDDTLKLTLSVTP